MFFGLFAQIANTQPFSTRDCAFQSCCRTLRIVASPSPAAGCTRMQANFPFGRPPSETLVPMTYLVAISDTLPPVDRRHSHIWAKCERGAFASVTSPSKPTAYEQEYDLLLSPNHGSTLTQPVLGNVLRRITYQSIRGSRSVCGASMRV